MRQLGVDGHEIVLVRHQQPMSGVEEHADLGASQGGGEVANFSLERRLVEIEAFDDLEAELLQCGADVGRVVLGVLELGRVAIGGIADDEGDALLRRGGDWRLPIRIGDSRSGWKKRSGEKKHERQSCDRGKPRAAREKPLRPVAGAASRGVLLGVERFVDNPGPAAGDAFYRLGQRNAGGQLYGIRQ